MRASLFPSDDTDIWTIFPGTRESVRTRFAISFTAASSTLFCASASDATEQEEEDEDALEIPDEELTELQGPDTRCLIVMLQGNVAC